MNVIDLLKNKSLSWECLNGPPEWPKTTITIELKTIGDKTVVYLEHRGFMDQDSNDYARTNTQWGKMLFLLKKCLEQ